MKSLFTLLLIILFSGLPLNNGDFVHPLQNDAKITTTYGEKFHPPTKKIRLHSGIDYAVPIGTKVFASSAGTVKFVGDKGSYGMTIIIKHDSGYETHYSHLSKFVDGLKKGQKLDESIHIGYSGQSGKAYAPLLHFEIRKDGKAVNPEKYLTKN